MMILTLVGILRRKLSMIIFKKRDGISMILEILKEIILMWIRQMRLLRLVIFQIFLGFKLHIIQIY